MADVQKTVEILFSADDQISKTVKGIGEGLNKLEDVTQTVVGPFASMADSVLAADAALTALAVGGLSLAYAKSVEFESSMVELEKVVGDNEAALEAAKQNAIDLGNEYGISAGKIVDSTANFKQAGFNVENAMTLAADSLNLVIAGGIESAESSQILINTLNGFKAPATEAARLVDILNEVSNNYATDVKELANGMADLSPIANQMGLSMEETAGVLTPVIEVFGSGSEAANALKTGLLKLIDDSKPVADALASIGVSQKDANGNLRSGKDILNDVSLAFQDLDDNQKLFITSQLVGIDQSAKMVEVFDGLALSSEVTATAMNAAGSAAAEVAARLASSEVQIDRFVVAFENLAIAVGDQFRESATGAISGLTEIETTLTQLVTEGTFDDLFSRLRRFADDVGEYFRGIAEALPEAFEDVDFDGLIEAFDGMGESILSFFGDLDLTQPEDLATAIQFAVDTIESLITVTAGMVESFKPVFDGIVAAIDGFNNLDTEAQKQAGGILGAAKIISEGGALVVAALTFIGDNATTFEAIFATVTGSIQTAWNGFNTAIDGIVITIMGALQTIVGIVDTLTFGVFGDELDAVRQKLDEWDQIWVDKFIKHSSGVNEGLKTIGTGIKAIGKDSDDTQPKIINVSEEIDKLIEKEDVEVDVLPVDDFLTFFRKTHEVEQAIDEIPEEKKVDIVAEADADQIKQTEEIIVGTLEDGTEIRISATPDVESAKEAQATIDEEIPAEKKVEIEAQLEVERIKAQAETIQTAIEWEARIDIAEVQAAADILKATFEALETSIQSTGDVITGLYDILAGGELSSSQEFELESLLRAEERRREEAFELQRKLTEEEIRWLEEKRKALSTGQYKITLEAAGLEPHLNALWMQIMEAIQADIVETGGEFLIEA